MSIIGFKGLVKKSKMPMLLMSFIAGYLGGIQTAVMRGMTISKDSEGFLSPITLAYLFLAGFGAIL